MATNKLPQFQSEGKHIKSVHGSSFITVEQQRITLLNLWQYEQMDRAANGADIFASVSLFNISELENFKIHCLKTFRVACAV